MAKLDLSPSHALYVLEQAFEDRKITRADVDRYSRKIKDEIASLAKRIADLRDAAGLTAEGLVEKADGWASSGKKAAKRAKRKVVSAERKASQKLQGQYLGYMRQISKTKRAVYQKLAKAAGREKAIAAMKKVLGK